MAKSKLKLIGDLPGQRAGRLLITSEFIKTDRGERKYLCRCDCGNEKYISERNLRYGGAMSCGCMRRENAYKSVSYDLTDKVFGELTVLHRADDQRDYGGVWWTCQCSCGNLYDAPGSILITGKRIDCGREHHERNYRTVDITGKKFNHLTALYPTKERNSRQAVIWHCRCDCGNEKDISYNNLVYGKLQSCGCQKEIHNKKLNTYLTHIADTSVNALKSKKVRPDNATGYTGVYLIKGKYVAKIVFQKKQYMLGSYTRLEDAAIARKIAEEKLFDGFVSYYEKYKQKADKDPEWAKNNPISAVVEKREDNFISISICPVL